MLHRQTRPKTYIVVLVVGKDRVHFHAHESSRLVCPSASHIAHSIATPTENKSRKVKRPDKIDAVGVATHAEIKTAKPVTRQAVSAALENDGLGLVIRHDRTDDRLKNGLVCLVINTVAEGEIHGIVLTRANANVAKFSRAREIFAIFVERNRHDPVGGIERLFDAVAMMNIDVDIKHTLLEAQQLQDGKDNVCRKS